MNFSYKLIDLTHMLDSDMPTWSGSCGFHHQLHIDYADCKGEEKFRALKIKMHAGIGTHIDAPSHCIPGGRFVHDFDIDELCMPCVVIDVSAKCHERYRVTSQDIIDFEGKYGPIQEGACVMIKTGWSKFWNNRDKYHNHHVFPSVSLEAAKHLLERDVSALGVDTLSPDRPEDGFKVHQAFLGSGKILIENVANVALMPKIGAFVMVCPMKVKHGTEAPVRLVGLIKKQE